MPTRNVLVIADRHTGIAAELARVPSVRYSVNSASGIDEALVYLSGPEPVPDCVVFTEDVAPPCGTLLRDRLREHDAHLPMVMVTGRRSHALNENTADPACGGSTEGGFIRLDALALDAMNLHDAISEAMLQAEPRRATPAAPVLSEAAPLPEAPPTTGRRSSPIPLALIIDDNGDDREACIRSLRRVADARYRFHEAIDGAAGLAAIVSERPDVVLLDYSLPGRNGLEVLSSIRQEHPYLPVIMLTGQGNEAVAVQGIKGGAVDYFTKSKLTGDALHRSILAAIELYRNAETIDRQGRTIRRQRDHMEASNHFLHSLLDHIPDPVFVKDSGGRWVLGNQALGDLAGPADRSGRRDLFPNEIEAFSTEDDRALSSGVAATNEQWIEDSNGVSRLFSVKRTTFADSKGEPVLVGVMRDITHQRQAEDDFKLQTAILVRQSQELAGLGAILEESRNEILIIDAASLLVVQANKGARLNLGYDHGELEDMNILDIEPHLTAQQFRALVEPLESGEQVTIVHHGMHRRKYGTSYDVEVHSQIGLFEGRKVFVEMVLDETERKRIERMKSEFISTVSHELRTPLTSIRGALGLINGGACGELPEKAASMVSIAHSNTERLVRLVNDILALEKSTSGELPLDIREVGVADFLRNAIESNAAYGVKHRVQFVVDGAAPPEGLEVLADSGRLMQIFSNLMSNAAKYSNPGASVFLRARASGANVRFEVEDRGGGIPLEFRPHLFEKFAQADSSVTRRHEGTGLGLCITKHLVEAMNGRIGYHSELGAGTTFYFELPRAGKVNGLTANGKEGVRVLVCEDDRDIAFIMKIVIEQAGFEVDTAYTIADARRKLSEESFSALTLDLKMPDADGLDFLRELASEIRTQGLPVIVVSAKADQERHRYGGAPGLVDWLAKPIDHVSLVRAVRKSILHRNSMATVLFLGSNDEDAQALTESLAGECQVVVAKTVPDSDREIRARQFDFVVIGDDIDEEARRVFVERIGSSGPLVRALSPGVGSRQAKPAAATPDNASRPRRGVGISEVIVADILATVHRMHSQAQGLSSQ